MHTSSKIIERCEIKKCYCRNGIHAVDTDCPKHGEQRCTSCNHPYKLYRGQCRCKPPYKWNPYKRECSECEKGFTKEIDQSTKEIICSVKVAFENVTMIDAAQTNTIKHFCQCDPNTGQAATGQSCTKENNYHCSL